MKMIVTTALTFALSTQSVQRARASSGVVAGCVVIVIAATGIGAIAIFAKRCKTYWWCVRDQESNTQWCRSLTMSATNTLGTNVISGPYDASAQCADVCSTNQVQSAQVFSYSNSSDSGDELPAKVLLQRSLDLVTWQDVATFALDTTQDYQSLWNNVNANRPTEFYRFAPAL